MKASAVLEEVFVKCDFKTALALKDHRNQAHQNLPKSH